MQDSDEGLEWHRERNVRTRFFRSWRGSWHFRGRRQEGSWLSVVNNGPLDAAAGVFTSNRFCAAPVQWSRNIVSDGHVKAVILNSGGANACTGKPGYEQSKATAEKVASLIGAKAEDVAVCSLVSSANAAARQRAVRRGQGIETLPDHRRSRSRCVAPPS